MPQSARREHLVDTAVELFAAHGFHATGIDLIVDKAGVSKKTLYRHFRSKDELILAALKKHDGVFRNDFMRQVEKAATTPIERLYAVFDVARDWFHSNKFYGCLFINAIGEYSEADTQIRKVAKEYKAMMRGFIRKLCAEAGLKDPDGLSKKLALLLEGAIVIAQVSETSDASDIAKDTARILIEQAQ